MLVFQTDPNHVFCRFKQRFPKLYEQDRSWLAKVVAEINLYLPDDWRLTRSSNNFRIQVMGVDMPAIVGQSFHLADGRILHRIDSIFKPGFADKYDEKEETPNLYFYDNRPDDLVTPLFARQYERVKIHDGCEVGDQYHRIHPLTKAGLDLEHYRWVHWIKGGQVLDVKEVHPDYHGRDYWLVPELSDLGGRRYKDYLNDYESAMAHFNVNLIPPQPPPHRHEIEYKFMVQAAGKAAAEAIFRDIEAELRSSGFTLQGSPQGFRLQTDTYLDDDKFSLHQVGASFRLRCKKDQIRITLKKRIPSTSGSGYSPEGLYERLEEEVTITTAQEKLLRDSQQINAFPYRLVPYIAPGCGRLQPVLVVENKRKTLLLADSNRQLVEVCFDQVYVSFEPNKKVGPFFEVEIESKRAEWQKVKDLAEHIGEYFGLLPSRQSKYERGVSLLKIGRQPVEKKLVIIDTDCGVDDALALILALKSPELDVKAITTVAGNVPVDKVNINVFKVLEFLNKKVPVAAGATRPLVQPPIVAESVHGKDGLGENKLPDPQMHLDAKPAWQVICDLAIEYPKQIILITIGPLTNLALAIQNNPAAVKKLKEVVAMGGVFFEVGNVGADAEFNVAADPDAAWEVVQFCRNSCLKKPVDINGVEVGLPAEPEKKDSDQIHEYLEHDAHDPDMVPLTFVGLDVSHKVLLRKAFLTRAVEAQPNKPLLKVIQEISAIYMQFYEDNEWLPGCYLHDPLAVAYVINPSFLEIEKHILKVETRGRFTSGMIFPDDRPTRNPAWRNPAEEVIGVARRVEKEAFEDFFLERLLLD